jgi:glycosyltransferase involved in cell wall biosynthesis/predicted O-methyltransferase YrrM
MLDFHGANEWGRNMIDLTGGPGTRLLTAFGTALYVDVGSGELRHGPMESSPANALFVADPSAPGPNRRGWLVHDLSVAREQIACLPDRCRTIAGMEAANAAPTMLELIPLERGLIALAAGGSFLSATPDGGISLSTKRCSTWELFLPCEAWCTEAPITDDGIERLAGPAFDRRSIVSYLVHPSIRARANTKPKGVKLLIYGYPNWSHGRVYYDLCKHLHRRGYIVDVLDWQQNHAGHFRELIAYYDLFMTALDGVSTLAGAYGVPYDRIIALSHHEFDIRMLIEQKGVEVFNEFAAYGVVSEFLYCASMMQGVPRAPMVAAPGINYSEFYAEIPERLATVGYASSMSNRTYGVEWKRGELAAAAAREAGLTFKVAGSTAIQRSFHDMHEFYKGVDAVVTSSISESAQLPVMEAAAAGRLVISTPVGHFPLKAYQGAGIMAPIAADKFTSFVADTLRYYKENPAAYVDKCRSIQEAAKKFDWSRSIDEWVELIEAAKAFSSRPTYSPQPIEAPKYEFTVDLFSRNVSVWAQLIDHLKPARILEIGSFEGKSTCYLIEQCTKQGAVGIYCVDTWEGGGGGGSNAMSDAEGRFDRNVALAQQQATHAASVKKFKKRSARALVEIMARQEAPFDLIYIDGSRRASDVLADAVLAFQLLRIGGIMIFDDYLRHLEPEGGQDPLDTPKPAIDAFINLFQGKLRVVAGLPLRQLYVEKKAS